MAKSYEQICAEWGKIPPEQSMKDEEELIAEIGEAAYWKEYLRVAKEKAKERFSCP